MRSCSGIPVSLLIFIAFFKKFLTMKRLTLILLSTWMTSILIAQPSFTEHSIESSFDDAWSTYVIDLDSDGDMDILGVGLSESTVTWWENDGSQNFTRNDISTSFSGFRDVFAIDMDDDGDVDILAAVKAANDIVWWENDGNENFNMYTIDYDFNNPNSVFAVDMDNDGDIDVLGAALNDDEVTWWENDGNENFATHIISDSCNGASDAYPIDLDSDGDMDVLAAAWDANDIIWWENDGFGNYTEYIIDKNFDRAVNIYPSDIDSDGDMDFLATSFGDHEVTWRENDGAQNFSTHVLAANFSNTRGGHATDMDGDGDIDLVAVSYINSKIAWWENDGSGNFTKHTLSTTANIDRPITVYAEDIDSDGDKDLICASYYGNDFSWFESDLSNQTLDFDGTDDYVTIGDIDAIDNVSQLTAAGWFYFDGVANGLRLISKQTAGGSDAGWHIALGGNNTGGSDDIRFTHNFDGSTNGDIYTTGLGLTTGHWYHIAVVYDGTQTTASDRIAIFLNGKRQTNNVDGNDVPTTLPATTEVLTLGAKSDGSDNFFQGNMDEVSIWRTALSQQSIRDIMHVMISDTTNLEAYYRFHVAAGTPTIGDDSGKRHTGTWSGASSGTNTTSTLSTETYPFTYSRINNVSGVWSATGTDGTNFSDGFRIYANTALTSTNLAVCGHDNAGTATITDDLTSSTAVSRLEQVWKVEVGGTVTDAILQFDLGTITGAAITAGTASDYVLLYRASTTGDFSDITTGNTTSNTDRVNFTGISLSEGYYTIGTKDNTNSPVLPVELLTFTAQKVERGVQLFWQTATEINNSHFEVEWSTDGSDFTPNASSESWIKIGTVEGRGTTNEAQEYGFLHTYPANGENYYRLRQVDLPAGQTGFDGAWEYSKTIQINYELSTDHAPLAIYPNPANDFITIQNGKTGDVVEIFNVNGQLIKAFQINSTIQTQSIRDLSSGLYFIRSGSSVEKLIIN